MIEDRDGQVCDAGVQEMTLKLWITFPGKQCQLILEWHLNSPQFTRLGSTRNSNLGHHLIVPHNDKARLSRVWIGHLEITLEQKVQRARNQGIGSSPARGDHGAPHKAPS